MDPLLFLGPLGLAAGVNLYLTVFVTGLLVRLGWVAEFVPDSLGTLGSWPVLVASALLAVVEFAADKVPYVDSTWDVIHTFIRPLGAMLIALNVLPDGNPAVTTVLTLLTGAGALTSHTSKAGLRALVNTSPEPFSNIALSITEDLSVIGLMMLAFQHPWVAAAIAVVVTIVLIIFLIWLYRFARRTVGGLKRFLRSGRRQAQEPGPTVAIPPSGDRR
ncbi:MAG: DUF4126 domain-containing protein [Acidimicrobiia bacterium]|nr:DUF4126 domain-containing protein [Acidimicrobiia bacterium]